MPNCPRCGVINKPGRTSCWKCWSPLPAERPTPVPTESLLHDQSAIQEEHAQPIASTTTAMETTAESPGHQQHLAESVPVLAPESHFTYVATPAVTASRRGAFWLMFAVVGITLLLVAAMLVWYYTFRPSTKSHVTPASSVSTRYLTALVAYDTSTQQQLATEKSKAVFLPSWLAIVSWQQVGEMKTESIHAEVPVELHLTIAPGTDVPNQSEVTNALTAPCHLRLVLQQEGDGWYVDQNALLHSLRYALEAKNADVAFPPWDEQSE